MADRISSVGSNGLRLESALARRSVAFWARKLAASEDASLSPKHAEIKRELTES